MNASISVSRTDTVQQVNIRTTEPVMHEGRALTPGGETVAHIHIGNDLFLLVTLAQAEQLRDQLTTAIAAHGGEES